MWAAPQSVPLCPPTTSGLSLVSLWAPCGASESRYADPTRVLDISLDIFLEFVSQVWLGQEMIAEWGGVQVGACLEKGARL